MIGKRTLRQRWIASGDSQGRTVAFGVAVLLVGWVVFLIVGGNPWISGFFQKVKSDAPLDLADFVVAGEWFAAALNALLLFVLLITSWWWMAPSPSAARAADRAAGGAWSVSRLNRGPSAKGGWWFWLLLVIALLLAGWLRVSRLSHEFSAAETAAIGGMIAGTPALGSDGSTGVAAVVPWQQTWFGRDPEGQQPIARAVARLSASIGGDWKIGEGAEVAWWKFRLGPLLAGMVSVGLLALWLRAGEAPLAGGVLALLLALNPWHLRWSTQVGGAAEALMWLILAVMLHSEARKKCRWRWWLLFAFGQALALLSCLASWPAVLVLSMLAGVGLLVRGDNSSFRRWLVATVLAATLVVQVAAPQWVRSCVDRDSARASPALGNAADGGTGAEAGGGAGQTWLSLWSRAAAGGQWHSADDAAVENGDAVAVEDLGVVGRWIFALILPLLMIAGLATIFLRLRVLRGLVLCAAGSVAWLALAGRPWPSQSVVWNSLLLAVLGMAALASLTALPAGLRSRPLLAGGSITAFASQGPGKVAWLVAFLLVGLYAVATWAPRTHLSGGLETGKASAVEGGRDGAPTAVQ